MYGDKYEQQPGRVRGRGGGLRTLHTNYREKKNIQKSILVTLRAVFKIIYSKHMKNINISIIILSCFVNYTKWNQLYLSY